VNGGWQPTAREARVSRGPRWPWPGVRPTLGAGRPAVVAAMALAVLMMWPAAADGVGGSPVAGAPPAGGGLGGASESVGALPDAQVAPTLVVTPATGLADGQTVEVGGSGFGAGSQVALGECRAGATSDADCSVAGALVATADSSGAFTAQFTVSRVLTIGTSTLDCSTVGSCVIAAGELPGLSTFATAAISFAPPPPPPAPTPTSPNTRYYLALGDSLATGFGAPAGQGYVDDLAAHYGAAIPGLQEVDLGCAGETTATFLSGGHCAYAQGSQLQAAEAFLSAHQGRVAFVTIDIGGDDITGCTTTAPTLAISASCVDQAIDQITANLATIGTGLRAAAGGSVPIAGMTYFDPYVVEWLTGPAGQQLAAASVTDLERLDAALSTDYAGFGASVADVAGAFSSTDLTDLVSSPYGSVPKSVAVACAWLLVVCEPGAVEAISVHPNATGYAQIAAAFGAVLQFPAVVPAPSPPTLPMTGIEVSGLLGVGLASALAGTALLIAVRRRRRHSLVAATGSAGWCGREDSNLHPRGGTGT
jgi:LPXTG-motif cell wall-anchored protein